MRVYVGGLQYDGETAADLAMQNNFPIIFAKIDPEAAKAKGEELTKAFAASWLVFVISTRFRMADFKSVCESEFKSKFESEDAWERDSCDPFHTAQEVKKALEALADGVCCFDPNGDNAFLVSGDAESANGIWLLTWRKMLEYARKTGGRVVQIVTPPGLSDMQIAEANMAKTEGVEVVKLDCTEIEYVANSGELKEMAGWAVLKGLAAKTVPQIVPPTREELLEKNDKQAEEIKRLLKKNDKQADEIKRLFEDKSKQSRVCVIS